MNLHHDVGYSSDKHDNEIEATDKSIFWNQDKRNSEYQNIDNRKNLRKQGKSIPLSQNRSGSKKNNDRSNQCGPINLEAVQQVLAAKWAIDVINNQSLPHEIKIGKSISIAIVYVILSNENMEVDFVLFFKSNFLRHMVSFPRNRR